MTAAPQYVRSRRNALAVAATLTAALAAPGVAGAATVKVTVVAKDAARGTLVTATRGGDVKTLRTAKVKRYRVGQRIVADATVRPDGTFATTGKVKRLRGSARTARVRATVVQRASGRYLLSAGSSTFAIGKRRAAAAAAAAAAAPQAGDIVDAKLQLGGGQASPRQLRTVGRAGMLEIEGIFLEAADGTIEIAVERRGRVVVAVPEGTTVSPTAGDEVEAIVSVREDGSFALVALASDDDDHGLDFDAEDGVVEIEGRIAELSETALTVAAGDATVTCGVPAGTLLDDFAVGDDVEMTCRLADDGAFTLVALESDEHEVEIDDDESEDDSPEDDD
jgi:hypothetical protein